MELLEKAIIETQSSIKYTDMSIYDEWRGKELEKKAKKDATITRV
jgi:hypothetical protein